MDENLELEEKPKKSIFNIFTKKDKGVSMDARSRNMAQPGQEDIFKLLGKPYQAQGEQNAGYEYVSNTYVPLNDSYKPFSETYQVNKYERSQYQPLNYEPPPYEPASGVLFGEQGKGWEESPVFKKTGVAFMERNEESPVFKGTGVGATLFGGGEPVSPVKGNLEAFPMKLPQASQLPYTKATLPPNLQPNVFAPQVVQQPIQPIVQPMPTLPTQVVPPQYVQPVMKRPVGRPRLNKPPKPKRPVGRPRKNVVVEQMSETIE